MSSAKLKFKRTPEDELRHQLKKERRRKRRLRDTGEEDHRHGRSSKRRHKDDEDDAHSRKWASSDEDDTPVGRKHLSPEPDYDFIKTKVEEERFRDKLFEAMGDDERLDSLEASFNDFAHIPDRWRSDAGGPSTKRSFHPFEDDDILRMDPNAMDEEEYAEWIRAGMYRKAHADEYTERQRAKAAKAARRAEAKARKAETARLEQEAEEERKQKKRDKGERHLAHAREEYGLRWSTLLANADTEALLAFDDIPWPIALAHSTSRRRREGDRGSKSVNVEDLTAEGIAAFLLSDVGDDSGPNDFKKGKKDKLRETFLRFHPDKFEGRFINRIKAEDQNIVREGISQVCRVLNNLMQE